MAKNLQFLETADKGSVIQFSKAYQLPHIEIVGSENQCLLLQSKDGQKQQKFYLSPKAKEKAVKALRDNDFSILDTELKVIESSAIDLDNPDAGPNVCLNVVVKTKPNYSADLW